MRKCYKNITNMRECYCLKSLDRQTKNIKQVKEIKINEITAETR